MRPMWTHFFCIRDLAPVTGPEPFCSRKRGREHRSEGFASNGKGYPFGQFRFAHCPTGYPLSACWGAPQTPEKS